MPSLHCEIETFPIAGRFVIARGAKTEARVVTVSIDDGQARGRGECVPYARYGESVESVVAAIEAMTPAIAEGLDRASLQTAMPPGAARNAVDCALWDLRAKTTGIRVHELAGLSPPAPVTTAVTISLDTPEAMAAAAARATRRPLLKVKLGGTDDLTSGDLSRLAAVRCAAPAATLIVDANEGWRTADLDRLFAACLEARVALIEQPLRADADGVLAGRPHPVPLCADESVHDRTGLAALRDRYDAVNVKLDKTGGLTEAIAVVDEAERLGFALMIGCMVGTSLAMAPALLLAARARFVDLDGPLLLAEDRPNGLTYEGSTILPPGQHLWG